MTELTKRLRDEPSLAVEAADEIERLTTEVARLNTSLAAEVEVRNAVANHSSRQDDEIEKWKVRAEKFYRALCDRDSGTQLKQGDMIGVPTITRYDDESQPTPEQIWLYNSGYQAGHHDTVEGIFTDVLHVDIETYHADVVAEMLQERDDSSQEHEPWDNVHGPDEECMTCGGCGYDGTCPECRHPYTDDSSGNE